MRYRSILCVATSLLWINNVFSETALSPYWFDQPACASVKNSPLKSWIKESKKYSNKNNPDPAWEKYATPVGNGQIGAMLYGGVELDRIQLNEHSLWTGGPGSQGWAANPNRMDGYKQLPAIRKALLAGDKKKALELSRTALSATNEDDHSFGRYQTLGELTVETGHEGAYQNYRRQLDLQRAVCSVQYTHHGVAFRRNCFVSNPDRCLVFRYEADRPGQQNLVLKFDSPHPFQVAEEKGQWVAQGAVSDNGLKLDVRIAALNEGGTVQVDSEGIRVRGADAVTFILVAESDYAFEGASFRGPDPAELNAHLLRAAADKGFVELKRRHVADHSKLFNRVELDLGTTAPEVAALPVDQRLKRHNRTAQDPDLEELYFQFGRYLLIACSRPGGLPANLQGIWCNEVVPAWNSDYHFNINLQMNYWPSGPCALSECQIPLIDYIDRLRGPGAQTAQAYSNARGWTANLAGNIWGTTSPKPNRGQPPYWMYFPMAGPWLTTHVFEHYAYTGDALYLRERAWPILRDTANFLVDYLFELPDGTLTSAPSWSPEHGAVSLGATTDIAMAREALKGALAAAEELGISNEEVASWRAAKERLLPYRIGKHGQLQEWYDDLDRPKDKHRHLNHLFGLYPGTQINPLTTPKLARAARVTLSQRGDGATGWSMGWKLNYWARMLDGNHAHKLLRNLFRGGTNPNLFDIHPPFQIDGNFGGTAGIAEMLLQSNFVHGGGEIHLLPALPDVWADGSFAGLRARGGFEVSCKWEGGHVVSAQVIAHKGGRCLVLANGEATSKRLAEGEVWTVAL